MPLIPLRKGLLPPTHARGSLTRPARVVGKSQAISGRSEVEGSIRLSWRAAGTVIGSMAPDALTSNFSHISWIVWILSALFEKTNALASKTLYMEQCDHSGVIELGGALIYSHHDFIDNTPYLENTDCQLKFKARLGWKLMMQVLVLDLPDVSFDHLCNDALYVFDADSIFGRPLEQAGGTGGLCGSSPPPVVFSSSQFLTIYFRSDNSGPSGLGFKLVITAYNEAFRHSASCGDDFQCANTLCIGNQLMCDLVDHCGDFTDEKIEGPAGCKPEKKGVLHRFLSLGIAATVGITVGTLVIIIACVACVICCCCRYYRRSKEEVTSPPVATVPTSNGFSKLGEVAYQPSGTAPHQTTSGGGVHYQAVATVPHGYVAMPATQSHTHNLPLEQQYVARHQNEFNAQIAGDCRNSGSASSSTNAPPSYYQTYTPPSSKSGRSHQSGGSAVKYVHHKDSVIMPAHV